MEVYIALIVFVFFLGFLTSGMKNKAKKNNIVVILTCIVLFLVYMLRDYRVGVDLEGYVYAYDNMDKKNYYETYLENGYVFLMEICNKIGLTFRGFLLILYLAFFIPFAEFLKRYSKDAVLSLIIFICYNFLVFTLSGLRQTVAMGICLVAFMVAQKTTKKALIWYILLIVLAMQFHKSAIVFLPAYFIMRHSLDKRWLLFYSIFSLVVILIRVPIVVYLNAADYTHYQFESNLTIGSTFYLGVLATLAAFYLSQNESIGKSEKGKIQFLLSNFANFMVFSILLKLLFSGTIMMRSAMYYEMLIMIMIPNMLLQINKSFSGVIRALVFVMLCVIFYVAVLVPRQFDIVPYILAYDLSLFK